MDDGDDDTDDDTDDDDTDDDYDDDTDEDNNHKNDSYTADIYIYIFVSFMYKTCIDDKTIFLNIMLYFFSKDRSASQTPSF